jgi:hypothetical protein
MPARRLLLHPCRSPSGATRACSRTRTRSSLQPSSWWRTCGTRWQAGVARRAAASSWYTADRPHVALCSSSWGSAAGWRVGSWAEMGSGGPWGVGMQRYNLSLFQPNAPGMRRPGACKCISRPAMKQCMKCGGAAAGGAHKAAALQLCCSQSRARETPGPFATPCHYGSCAFNSSIGAANRAEAGAEPATGASGVALGVGSSGNSDPKRWY